MSDDKTQTAQDEAKVIEEKLANAKLALIHEAYMLAMTSETAHLRSIARRREAIEALEYALTCVPPKPARTGSVKFSR